MNIQRINSISFSSAKKSKKTKKKNVSKQYKTMNQQKILLNSPYRNTQSNSNVINYADIMPRPTAGGAVALPRENDFIKKKDDFIKGAICLISSALVVLGLGKVNKNLSEAIPQLATTGNASVSLNTQPQQEEIEDYITFDDDDDFIESEAPVIEVSEARPANRPIHHHPILNEEWLNRAFEYTANEILNSSRAETGEIEEFEEVSAEANEPIEETQEKTLPSEVMEALDERLGEGFSEKLIEICKVIKCEPKDLVGMMYSESSLNPKKVNPKSKATGLIQIIPRTAKTLGTTVDKIKRMSAIEQLDIVERYFTVNKRMFKIDPEKELTAGDLYAINWLPAYANLEGKEYFKKTGSTKEELAQKIDFKYHEWLTSENIAVAV